MLGFAVSLQVSAWYFTADVLICRVRDGCLDVGPHYGLELARLGDFPNDVTTEAKRVANLLADKETEKRLASTSSKVISRRKTLTAVRPDKLEETEAQLHTISSLLLN